VIGICLELLGQKDIGMGFGSMDCLFLYVGCLESIHVYFDGVMWPVFCQCSAGT
jgi:hypothetical protein